MRPPLLSPPTSSPAGARLFLSPPDPFEAHSSCGCGCVREREEATKSFPYSITDTQTTRGRTRGRSDGRAFSKLPPGCVWTFESGQFWFEGGNEGLGTVDIARVER